MSKAKKVRTTRKAKKTVKKSRPANSQELRITVVPQEVIPTTSDLSEPIRDGKSLTIPKTWLSEKQITRLVEKTPKQYVYQRPGKGGGKWDYVTVSYIQRVLDYCFGFNWDFEVVEHGKEQDHVWVLGKLTVRDPQNKYSIVKTQFGRSEVKHKQGSKDALDYGNDLKAATSDALKKCASMFGIARDIYGKGDYKQESGVTPRPAPEDTRTPEQKVHEAIKTTTERNVEDSPAEFCKGIDGKACSYGNDVEPLAPEVASYSKKMFKKPLCRECQSDAKKK